ncbi:core protein 2 [Duck adenovirus 1]|uniref:Core protein 2 n=2 Tax=Duck atadenovirus A TaxID=130328 RepID=O11419_DADV1|nr:core protein 2 (mu protein) [Duck atadenovirus A]AP_000086.1 pX [Duck atadenovirus A]AGS11272.1 core protein 2 [Duck adenovirus 1]AJA72332.1 core protein 2 [Duck adenovirus 1]AJA72361.1 core protein 2 [Duck adenovirus 1]AJA72390.1 core protein 2 [Duck adenovirus 1]AJA72419.1 core protein 2 [Duck adenovirus 1]
MRRSRSYGGLRYGHSVVRYRRSSQVRARRPRRRLKGGFLPAIIPLIAAAISAAPAIAGTVIAAKNAR